MMFEWFNAREATEIGTALASQLAPYMTAARNQGSSAAVKGHKALAQLLERVDREVR
jgi:hypothetical protein